MKLICSVSLIAIGILEDEDDDEHEDDSSNSEFSPSFSSERDRSNIGFHVVLDVQRRITRERVRSVSLPRPMSDRVMKGQARLGTALTLEERIDAEFPLRQFPRRAANVNFWHRSWLRNVSG